ncbi:MAG: hypothetical protein ACXWMV_06135, partial [Syntrophales bacterium]
DFQITPCSPVPHFFLLFYDIGTIKKINGSHANLKHFGLKIYQQNRNWPLVVTRVPGYVCLGVFSAPVSNSLRTISSVGCMVGM